MGQLSKTGRRSTEDKRREHRGRSKAGTDGTTPRGGFTFKKHRTQAAPHQLRCHAASPQLTANTGKRHKYHQAKKKRHTAPNQTLSKTPGPQASTRNACLKARLQAQRVRAHFTKSRAILERRDRRAERHSAGRDARSDCGVACRAPSDPGATAAVWCARTTPNRTPPYLEPLPLAYLHRQIGTRCKRIRPVSVWSPSGVKDGSLTGQPTALINGAISRRRGWRAKNVERRE